MAALLDLVLNLVCLLLWLNWRSSRLDPLVRTSVSSLVGTLRRTDQPRLKRWHLLATLGGVLFCRALLYWQLGPAINWTPSLQLNIIAIPFRSEFLGRMMLFSVLSFAVTLGIFYLWILLISLVNTPKGEMDPLQRLLRQHLGVVDRWPWALKLLLPVLGIVILWLGASPLLAHIGLIPRARSLRHCIEQGLALGLGACLTWKYLIGLLLGLYILNSYVYLGMHSFWTFVNMTALNLLKPLRWLPLRISRVDFSPLLAIALTFIAAAFAEWGLSQIYWRLPL